MKIFSIIKKISLRTVFFLCLVTLFVLTPHNQSFATTLRYISFEKIVAFSGRIVEGEVSSVKSKADDSGKSIHTFVTLVNIIYHKGDGNDELTLRFEGGFDKKLNRGVDIPGVPTFKAGEKVILFLRAEEQISKFTISPVLGVNQGYFSITQEDNLEILKDGLGKKIIGFDSKDRLLRLATEGNTKKNNTTSHVNILGAPKHLKPNFSSEPLTKDLFVNKVQEILADTNRFTAEDDPIRFRRLDSVQVVSAPEMVSAPEGK